MSFYIVDVCDVTFTRKSDGHTVFTSEAQISSLSQTVDEETIKGGIGSRSIYTIRHSKEVELTVQNATFDLEWLAMTQGVAIKDGETFSVKKKVDTVVGEEGSIDAPESVTAGTEVNVLDINKKSTKIEVSPEGTISVPAEFAAAGDKVQIIYDAEVTGDVVEMRADRFAEKYEVQYFTIVSEAETGKHSHDLYINFHEVMPSSSFEMSLENGSAFTPSLSFTATANEKSEIGTFALVPVA